MWAFNYLMACTGAIFTLFMVEEIKLRENWRGSFWPYWDYECTAMGPIVHCNIFQLFNTFSPLPVMVCCHGPEIQKSVEYRTRL